MLQHCFRILVISTIGMALCAVQVLYADDVHKWGKITPEEWAMTSPAEYPHSPAIVLFDAGSLKTGPEELKYGRHTRHKIFDRLASSKIINIEIMLSKSDKFSGFSAQTYLPNGKKHSINTSNLLTKTAEAFDVISFTFPAVEDGCIIELKYEITSLPTSRNLPPWHFQNEFYTLQSQFSFSAYPGLIFNNVAIGLRDTLPTPTVEEIKIDRKPSKRFTWTLRDVPPFIEEPLQGAKLNFVPSMYIQFSGYSLQQAYPVSILDSWSDLARGLSPIYESKIVTDDSLQEVVDSLTGVGPELQEKQIETLFEFVRNEITSIYDEQPLFTPSQTTSETLRLRAGTGIDKNLLLIAMARLLRIDANPILIASRDYARFSTVLLNPNQFNYMLCYIKSDSLHYYLDTSNKAFPFPYLAPPLLAVGGLVLPGYRAHQFEYSHSATIASRIAVDTLHLTHHRWSSGIRNAATVWLGEDGSAVCTSRVTIFGYDQLSLGPERNKTIDNELIADLLRSLTRRNFEIAEVLHVDSLTRDSISFDIVLNVSDFGTRGDRLLTCVPSLLWSGENRFSNPNRQFPVDYYFSGFYSETIVLYLPKGFSVVSMPNNASEITPDLLYSRAVLHDEHTARIMTNMMNKSDFIFPTSYSRVREFYQKVTSSVNESLTATEQ